MFGLILFVISMQKHNKKLILRWQAFSFTFYTMQYFLLGAYSGMLSYLINMIRSVVFFIFEVKRSYVKYLVASFIIISIVLGIATYKGVFDIIPIINSVLSILNISQKNVKNIKLGQIMISSLWIVYDIRVYSYIAFISEIIVIISVFKGLKSTIELLYEKNE